MGLRGEGKNQQPVNDEGARMNRTDPEDIADDNVYVDPEDLAYLD